MLNQGIARAAGQWQDTVLLLAPNGSTVVLGNFVYDRGLDAGKNYTRTEQVRLPSKIEGGYRLRVVTNSLLGGSGPQVYEYGDARNNNTKTDTDAITVHLNDRPDLRVTDIEVPPEVTAGTSTGLKFTVGNFGPEATSGQWQDYVYLSLDGIVSADDVLLARVDSGSALSPGGDPYTTTVNGVTIPIRYRGDVYIIVVADGGNRVDEYPSDGNNARSQKLHINPVPFADLVTSDVVAPDQVVHGATIEVRYKVTNKGSAETRGDAATTNSWTDTVWLTVDKTRPNPAKGDIRLGSFTHTGKLAIGEDYINTVNVKIRTTSSRRATT